MTLSWASTIGRPPMRCWWRRRATSLKEASHPALMTLLVITAPTLLCSMPFPSLTRMEMLKCQLKQSGGRDKPKSCHWWRLDLRSHHSMTRHEGGVYPWRHPYPRPDHCQLNALPRALGHPASTERPPPGGALLSLEGRGFARASGTELLRGGVLCRCGS
jgi:hypothetical protein